MLSEKSLHFSFYADFDRNNAHKFVYNSWLIRLKKNALNKYFKKMLNKTNTPSKTLQNLYSLDNLNQ